MLMNKPKIAIFVVDDDEGTRLIINAALRKNNIDNYTIFSNPSDLLEALHKNVQICIIDYDLRDLEYNGVSLMIEIHRTVSYCKCIIMSGYEDFDILKKFINCGAFKYLTKGEDHFLDNLIGYIKDAINIFTDNLNHNIDLLNHLERTAKLANELKDG